ncbi:MAG: hypothetical protein QOE54_1373 [Streptosporangiaceae bacterium]|jgi:hypothetical protein|nr:hypothetical protein [Streptosporangiaceae bacterium]MDX6429007.1 hypothetical protein [Streptosporangiaceae bacterium]
MKTADLSGATGNGSTLGRVRPRILRRHANAPGTAPELLSGRDSPDPDSVPDGVWAGVDAL